MIDLHSFAKHGTLGGRSGIFSAINYTYATNGHIAIRVARRVEIEIDTSMFARSVVDLFKRTEDQITGPWLQLPVLPEPYAKRVCLDCDGEGCSECDDGWKTRWQSVELGGLLYHCGYLDLLAKLPTCTIAVNGRNPAWFQFHGGDGLLMPMNAPA